MGGVDDKTGLIIVVVLVAAAVWVSADTVVMWCAAPIMTLLQGNLKIAAVGRPKRWERRGK